MAQGTMLIGDVGGTNARFAVLDEATFAQGMTGKTHRPYRDEQVLQCADYESAEAALSAYLAPLGIDMPEVICLAAAGPVVAGCITLTNNHWRLSEARLGQRFTASRVRLLNDFEAIAYGLPLLGEQDCLPLGPLPMPPLSGPSLAASDWTLGVVGPGTGLGAAGLAMRQGQRFPLVTEAGHLGFAPESDRQKTLWEALRQRFGRVSDERLVSGAGLENIYAALAALPPEGSKASEAAKPAPKAADIFANAETDSLAQEALALFFEILGQVAGNFALSIGAFDGVFIAGGIVQRYPALIQSSAFRQGFASKGRHSRLMESVPTALIQHENPGLLGAAWLAARALARPA